MFYNALAKFRDEQLENYQGQPLEYSASDYHHISRPGGRVRRGRSQTGQGNSKRRAQCPSPKEFPRRLSSFKGPMSSGTMESYDPYRSPKHIDTAPEAKYAQITIHRELIEQAPVVASSPRVKPPPSIAEEQEPEESDGSEGSPFTVLQKRKHGPSSMKSSLSSKMPHSSSRAPGMSTHSMSYRRNVSFRHARNRSHGSTTAKPKKRKIATPNQRNEIKRSPSVCSLQLMAEGAGLPDLPSSPPLPAQPMMVRPNPPKVKNMHQVRKIRESDYTWKEDTRKVSHELSQICEEAFNGSSVTTIRTASAGSGYETPATPVSMASPQQAQIDKLITLPGTAQEPIRGYNIKELTETRRKLIEHSRGRTDNIPAYLAGVISHLDRLIAEDELRNTRGTVDMASFQDPFVTGPNETLPVINEDSASPVRAPSDLSPGHQQQVRTSLASSQGGDAKATIRMVPHSSFRSMEEVKPLTIRKKNHGKNAFSDVHDFGMGDSVTSDRNLSTAYRYAGQPVALPPIQEVPRSPKKSPTRGPENKKWSWFRHRSQGSDTPPTLPPKDTHPIIPSGATTVHKPITLHPASPPRAVDTTTERVPTRKTSMDRFGGAFLKRLMPKKSNKNLQEDTTSKDSQTNFLSNLLTNSQIWRKRETLKLHQQRIIPILY
jgi:serine/threonine-protein kinase HSL1 (negative regulator of Swe1 kinase)